MSTLINQGLIITGIGMGLVFAAIIFLWGLMALMVRLDGNNIRAESSGTENIEEKPDSSNLANKKRAAAAAVALALECRRNAGPSMQMAARESTGSWKNAQRAQVLQDKSRIFSHRQDRRS